MTPLRVNHASLPHIMKSGCKQKLQINLCSPVLPYYLTVVPSTRYFRRFVAREEKNIRREDSYRRELCLVTGLVIDHWTEDRRKTYMSRTSFYDLGTKPGTTKRTNETKWRSAEKLSHPVVTYVVTQYSLFVYAI